MPPVTTTDVCAMPAKTSVMLWLKVEVITGGVKKRAFSRILIESKHEQNDIRQRDPEMAAEESAGARILLAMDAVRKSCCRH